MERMVSRTLSVHVGLDFPVLMEPVDYMDIVVGEKLWTAFMK